MCRNLALEKIFLVFIEKNVKICGIIRLREKIIHI
jgi:hypothetical protein